MGEEAYRACLRGMKRKQMEKVEERKMELEKRRREVLDSSI